MQFGICTAVENSGDVKSAGWDFVEESVQGLLQGQLPDSEWQGAQRVAAAKVPVRAANLLVPAKLKITGPEADMNALRTYMEKVLERAGKLGVKTLVFGSGGARNVPDGFDRAAARGQIAAFAKMSAEIAKKHGVTIVIEPLNQKECNIINSVEEGMIYVKEVNHPNLQCLVDSYHFWLEDEPLTNLQKAMPWIKHVHVADKVGRTAPGESGQSDYRPFFRVLKEGKYEGLISVEATGFKDIANQGPRVLEFLQRQWSEA